MIYQENSSFIFCPFKCTYDGQEVYISDKERYEQLLLEELQIKENITALNENREPQTVVLPVIDYSELTYTQEEIDRLVECQKTNASLDDVREYVTTGIFPNRSHSLMYLENKKLKQKVSDMNVVVDDMTLVLADMLGNM